MVLFLRNVITKQIKMGWLRKKQMNICFQIVGGINCFSFYFDVFSNYNKGRSYIRAINTVHSGWARWFSDCISCCFYFHITGKLVFIVLCYIFLLNYELFIVLVRDLFLNGRVKSIFISLCSIVAVFSIRNLTELFNCAWRQNCTFNAGPILTWGVKLSFWVATL